MKSNNLDKAIGLVCIDSHSCHADDINFKEQKEQIETWAYNNDIEIETYITSTNNLYNNDDITALDSIIDGITKGTFESQLLVVTSFNAINSHYLTKFQRAKIPIVKAVKNSGSTFYEQFTEKEDVIKRALLGLIIQREKERQSQLVHKTLNHAASKGYFTGRHIPFGYRVEGVAHKVLSINPIEVPIVRKIFSLANSKDKNSQYSLSSIARILNSEGMLRRGKRWSYKYVARVLRNTIYKGYYLYGKNRASKFTSIAPVFVKVPKIVSCEDFDTAQLILDSSPNTKD